MRVRNPHYVAQASLKFMGGSHPPVPASGAAGTIGVCGTVLSPSFKGTCLESQPWRADYCAGSLGLYFPDRVSLENNLHSERGAGMD